MLSLEWKKLQILSVSWSQSLCTSFLLKYQKVSLKDFARQAKLGCSLMNRSGLIDFLQFNDNVFINGSNWNPLNQSFKNKKFPIRWYYKNICLSRNSFVPEISYLLCFNITILDSNLTFIRNTFKLILTRNPLKNPHCL